MPYKPDHNMTRAGNLETDIDNASVIWEEMLSAAPKPSDEDLERAARAYDREDAAQRGEPSPWDVHDCPTQDCPECAEFKSERLACLRAALDALGA